MQEARRESTRLHSGGVVSAAVRGILPHRSTLMTLFQPMTIASELSVSIVLEAIFSLISPKLQLGLPILVALLVFVWTEVLHTDCIAAP